MLPRPMTAILISPPFVVCAAGNQRLVATPSSEERVALNDDAFRKANDRIGTAARDVEVAELVPFLCECADPACTMVIQLSLDEYERVRRHSRWFLCVQGHETAAGDASAR